MIRQRLAAAWPLLQTAIAAMVAWLLAKALHGDADPFFAPVAAVVAMNAPRGERGLQAVRLLMGVVVGIAMGEVIVLALGAGYGRIALAVFLAMAIATAIGGARTVVTNAGTSAVLTVIAASGTAGVHRLIDAILGGGVALVFSQVIFSPEPVALLRRAESAALAGIADGLEATADALARGDEERARHALDTLRSLRGRLDELARQRDAGRRVVRHSAIWRSQTSAVAREREHADRLDLLASGSVMLARIALERSLPAPETFADRIRQLSVVLAALAKTPEDRATRQRAADQALDAARPIASGDAASEEMVVAFVLLRLVARDVMVFAGLTAEQAEAAVLAGEGGGEVPKPPASPIAPFGFDRRLGLDRRRRTRRRSSRELPHRTSDAADGDAKE